MKQTNFRFEIRVAPDDSEATLDNLKTELSSLKGINSVGEKEKEGIVELSLSASFQDAEEAKRLHCKVMTKIMDCEGVVISQVSTMLTDIF